MKSILVTGGAGFIGSHTSLLLLEKGFVIFVLDSLVNSSDKQLEKVKNILKDKGIETTKKIYFIKGDMKNQRDIEMVFQLSHKIKKNIEAVIHFAGLKSVSESILNPFKYWENNLLGTINLLKIMEKFGCRNIVFSSSATVYKNKSNSFLNENDVCEPINPYGQTKLSVEKLLKDVYNSAPLEWRIASLRYFNPIGSHESGLIGEDPLDKPNNLYPLITRVAIGKIDSIKIFGSDWPTPDGTGIRDYIHVMDLAEGHFLALSYLLEKKSQFITLNLGTGKGTSVLDLIQIFQKVNNVEIPYFYEDRRPGDNAFVVADNSLAKNTLGWTPKRNIEDMCRDGWKWQFMHFNDKGYLG